MVAGREVSPKDVEDTERLMDYWSHGAGGAILDWGVPGDFNRCRVALSKYVGPDVVDGLCANLHHRATGAWPGHAPLELADKAAKKEAKGK